MEKRKCKKCNEMRTEEEYYTPDRRACVYCYREGNRLYRIAHPKTRKVEKKKTDAAAKEKEKKSKSEWKKEIKKVICPFCNNLFDSNNVHAIAKPKPTTYRKKEKKRKQQMKL